MGGGGLGCLTVVLFAALPLCIIYSNWGQGVTGPTFG